MVSLKCITTLLASAVALSVNTVQAVTVADLPIFFFHGYTGSITDSVNIAANLTAEGRTFTPLTFCSNACSTEAIPDQIPLALEAVRSVIANDTAAYENGYIVMGHSQGAVLARAVIENWDEHNVQLFISLAGSQNGLFYGPQAADAIPTKTFFSFFGTSVFPTAELFNVSSYTADDYNGKFQYDLTQVFENNPELMTKSSYANRWRSPVQSSWIEYDTVLPVLNNVNVCQDSDCEDAQATRRDNFLRIQQSHYMISSRDGVEAPWQSCLFGQYSYLTNDSQILTDFESLEVISMEDTIEYQNDTYGLKTAYEAGRLHLREVPDVVHGCWLRDSNFADITTEVCSFNDIFGANVYPLLFSSDEVVAPGSSSASASSSSTVSSSSSASSTAASGASSSKGHCSDHA